MGRANLQVTPLVLVLGLVTACGAETDPPGPRASSAPPAVCSDPGNDDGRCARELKDSHLRTPVPPVGQDQAIDETVVEIYHRARDAGCTGDVEPTGRCAGPSRMAATERYVAKVQESLANAGYPDAVVRLGRAEDPTALGALIWAVRVGDYCVLGDVTPPPVERTHFWHAGLLPDGRCLTA